MKKIITLTAEKKIIRLYTEISQQYHLVYNSDIIHKLLEVKTNELLDIVYDCYKSAGIEIETDKILNRLKFTISAVIFKIFKGVAGYTNKNTDYIIDNVCVISRANGSRNKKIQYDNSTLYALCKEVFTNNDSSTKLKRSLLYDMIRKLYYDKTGRILDMNNNRLYNYVYYHNILKSVKRSRVTVNEYISERYSKGQRLFFSNYIAKELEIDTNLVNKYIDTKLYPGISVMNSKDYIDDLHVSEYISINKSKLVYDVMVDLRRDVLYNSTSYAICKVIANNVYLHHRYMTLSEVKRLENDLVNIARRPSTKRLIYHKHGEDISQWAKRI